MNKLVKFISGIDYPLKDLFGDDTKIVIPDLQRDYCWGDNAYTAIGKDKKPQELVSGFLKNLINLYQDDAEAPVTLGLIYGYEQPYNHIQICDGQQRLTTLFLILGAINMKCKGVFDHYIISEKEMKDDYEPHLLYAIRESTLYCLSDLSLHLFIKRELEIANIRSSKWYFKEYDQDASIQSIISALEIIDKIIELYPDLDYRHFGDYLLNNLRIFYYDMGNRSQGEETYVVINTTGEPLSATENIKPILLADPSLTQARRKKYADQWEEREEWFWKYRGSDKTSDNGMQIFFMWYWQIGLQQEYRWEGDRRYQLNIKELFMSAPKKVTDTANETKLSIDNYNEFRSLDNLNSYFEALDLLVKTIAHDESMQRVLLTMSKKESPDKLSKELYVWTWLRSADLDIVLPLLCFVKKYGDTDLDLLYKFIRRIQKNHFDGVWSKTDSNQLSRRGKNYVDWRYIIQIISKSSISDIFSVDVQTLDISKIPMIPLNDWYTEDDKWKAENIKDIDELENIEDHELLMGDLTPLRKGSDGTSYDIVAFKMRWNNLKRMNYAFDAEASQNDKEFSNWFRLYCVVIGITAIEHISYCSWDFEGCYFSQKRKMPWWIETAEIDHLLCREDILESIKQTIKEKVSGYIRRPQDNRELIISWLTIKSVKASIDGALLCHYNQRAVSAFNNLDSNYIVPSQEFQWGNVLCGYSWGYTVFPARDEQNWAEESNLDAPISSIPFIPDYYNRDSHCLDEQSIKKSNGEIEKIIDDFLVAAR